MLRDQLVAGAVLDAELIAAISRARSSGASVEISAVGEASRGLEQFQNVARSVLDDARPGEHIQIRWRPHAAAQRLGGIAIIGNRPALDWVHVDTAAHDVVVSSSWDESSALLELVIAATD